MQERAEFQFGVKAQEVREEDDGTLIIRGLASDFETDRDLEAFEPGAFEEGLKAFMQNPILLYHHKPDHQLGVVREAHLDGKGLHIEAAIPKPPEGSWATHVYNLVKNGMMRGFSVGGAFYRRMTDEGPKIFRSDTQEVSVTPLPVNPRTLFGVAGKAFGEDTDPELLARMDDLEVVFEALSRRVP